MVIRNRNMDQNKQHRIADQTLITFLQHLKIKKKVEESSSSDKKYIFTLWQEPRKTRVPEINAEINGVEIMDKGAYQKIKPTQLIKLTEVRC